MHHARDADEESGSGEDAEGSDLLDEPLIGDPDDPSDRPLDDEEGPVVPLIGDPDDPSDRPLDDEEGPVVPLIGDPDDPPDRPLDDEEGPVVPLIGDPDDPSDRPLDDEEGPVVPLIVDTHEPDDVYARLEGAGLPVERRKLHPADYVIGPVAVERKTVSDFFSSLKQKRLFEQVVRLKETYPRPLLLLEGDLSRVAAEYRNPSAFWGALTAIAVDVGVPVLPAPDKDATALLLARVHARVTRWAAREAARGEGGRRADVRFKPRAPGVAAEQKFAVQGLPRIGDVASEKLLERFGSVRRVYAANEKELTRVPGIGTGKARAITEFLDRPFTGAQKRLPGEAARDDESE